MNFTKILICFGMILTSISCQAAQDIRTRYYQREGFILSEPLLFEDERNKPGNDPDLKQLSRTVIKGGLIYDSKGKLLDTNNGNYLYVINHDGTIYTSASQGGVHHSFYLKSKPNKFGFGIGKNVACAGYLNAKAGKIIYIDNDSGHYKPIADQLKLSIQYLNKLDVLSPHIFINLRIPDYEGFGTQEIGLKSILSVDPKDILAPYPVYAKRSREYVEARRQAENDFQSEVERLKDQCPRSFRNLPISDLIPNFHILSGKTRIDFGKVTIRGQEWQALLFNLHPDVRETITQAPSASFKWDPNFSYITVLDTSPINGVATRYAACAYIIKHELQTFNFALVPTKLHSAESQGKTAASQETEKIEELLSSACPQLTVQDIEIGLTIPGVAVDKHFPLGRTFDIEKDSHKYRLSFTAATHIGEPGEKILITQNAPKLVPDKTVCKYSIQTENGGRHGEFELTLVN